MGPCGCAVRSPDGAVRPRMRDVRRSPACLVEDSEARICRRTRRRPGRREASLVTVLGQNPALGPVEGMGDGLQGLACVVDRLGGEGCGGGGGREKGLEELPDAGLVVAVDVAAELDGDGDDLERVAGRLPALGVLVELVLGAASGCGAYFFDVVRVGGGGRVGAGCDDVEGDGGVLGRVEGGEDVCAHVVGVLLVCDWSRRRLVGAVVLEEGLLLDVDGDSPVVGALVRGLAE